MNSEPSHTRMRQLRIRLAEDAMTGDKQKFLKAGMNDYLAKPVRMEDLERMLKIPRGGKLEAHPGTNTSLFSCSGETVGANKGFDH